MTAVIIDYIQLKTKQKAY